MDADIEAARPWVEEAAPTFVTLVDQNHVLSELYNMVNVPQAVWIDENGRVVRPTETGGSLDILREFDFEAGGFPEEATQRSQKAKANYLEAVKDWAIKGAASRFAYSTEQARTRVPTMSQDIVTAHAKFRLGQYLRRLGREQEAQALFAESRDLHPDSWNIFRETTEKMESGIAAGEEFWNKVMSLGDKEYYAAIEMSD
jgi:tetratricopeptide (TPR) repeat protein